jgi:transposase
MPRSGPRKLHKYSDEFKLTAVRLSQQPGIQVKTVAAALEIHPFMLSKWRKDARDGKLQGKVRKAPAAGPAREIARLEALEREYANLKEEHELLKKPAGSVPLERRRVRLHRHRARALQRDASVSALRCDHRWVLCLASSSRERTCGAGPAVTLSHQTDLPGARGPLWESPRAPSAREVGRLGESAPGCSPHARGGAQG